MTRVSRQLLHCLRRSRPTIPSRFIPLNIERALRDLRRVRTLLRDFGAPMAADATARAIKSTEGALRHANRHGFMKTALAPDSKADEEDRGEALRG